jgi:uncharacterized protein with HEPN domain
LQIIGEAARTLPDDVRAMAPDIPWTKMIGMRNILVHGYCLVRLNFTLFAICLFPLDRRKHGLGSV